MKGVIFSFILIVTTIIILSFISIQRGLVYFSSERIAIENRVNSMLNFYNSIILDGGKALEIISTRAISSAINYVIINGIGLQEANETIKELILNGTINGTQQDLMQDSTIIDWKNKMVSLGNLQGFNADINFSKILVKPYDSWNILVSAEMKIHISDKNGVANLTKSAVVNQLVNIENFEDPIYVLYTYGKTTNFIVKSPYIGNYTKNLISANGKNGWFYGTAVIFNSSQIDAISSVSNKNEKVLVTDSTFGIENLANQFGAVVSQSSRDDNITVPFVYSADNAMTVIPNNTNILVDGPNGKVWYIDNLKNDVENSYYHPSDFGASFLDRLEGKLFVQSKYRSESNNTIGLESFVNKDYFLSLGINVNMEKSNIDYIYFSNLVYPIYKVKGMPEDFRIDKQVGLNNISHDVVYGVDQILV
jgi:hypothetical protein